MSFSSSKCTSDSVCKLALSDVSFYVSPYQKCFCEPLNFFKIFWLYCIGSDLFCLIFDVIYLLSKL